VIEMAIAKLKSYKFPGSDPFPEEFIQAGGEILRLLVYQITRRVIKLNAISIVGYHCYQLPTTFYPIFFSQG
jgi:hypothetical protein